MKKIITLSCFTFLFLIVKSQDHFYGSGLIRIETGTNFVQLPGFINELEMVEEHTSISHGNGTGENKWKIANFKSNTIGLDLKATIWPIHLENIGVGYQFQYSPGWAPSTTRSIVSQGFAAYIGLNKIKFTYNSLNIGRNTAYFRKDLGTINKEKFAKSRYSDIQRRTFGLAYDIKKTTQIRASIFNETFDNTPIYISVDKIKGYSVSYEKFNDFKIALEFIVSHPIYGEFDTDNGPRDLSEINKDGLYFQLSFMKLFDFTADNKYPIIGSTVFSFKK